LRQVPDAQAEPPHLAVLKHPAATAGVTLLKSQAEIALPNSGTSDQEKPADQTGGAAPGQPPVTAEAASRARVRCGKQLNEPDKVDPNFRPWVSEDGRSVTLSAKHPSVTLTIEAHQRLLWSAHGVATLHLRGLLKHFFSREVLAESSVTGVGAYKRQLDKDIVLGIFDYIGNRYPGAMTESRMRLCCTDVCVQARRRRRSRDVIMAASGDVDARVGDAQLGDGGDSSC
uniref:BEN domain-containing protein n=1 Tax=Macrostomum lignano TaxID=282301 RepID=A0A1I8JIK2_9PLAT